jgi:ATP-dependent RNA helicase SUPV3L1/SUV3
MDVEREWTHEEVVTAAREALVAELGIEGSELATAFINAPIGPRVRVGGVRAGLARMAVEDLARSASDAGFRFGGYLEPSDEVTLLLPAAAKIRADLHLGVLTPVTLKLPVLALDIGQRGPAAVAAELRRRKPVGTPELERRLRETPPAYEGWDRLTQVDLDRAIHGGPPLLTDRKDVYQRLRAACAHAVDRSLLDDLAKRNPGFLDYLQCFPLARTMHRKIVAWLGPTNSGKTHQAMLALRDAESGMYLGPLRLLALEQRDRLVEMGTLCSLITGEERDHASDTHSARTVEMTDFARRYDVCVLDEIQLAFDRDRGWAWVAAYCGVAAETLIVTGPDSAEPVIRRLAELCGDTVEVNHRQRQGALEFEGVIDWRRVPPRSAVIGFSRAMVLELKSMFESRGLRVSVIYGNLSPEVRRNEARRFRDGESDIVVATDAIGLGLNLPLDRVIFYETDKFDGEINRRLEPSELLQIAGRAGRGPGATGWVAAFSTRDARRIEAALAEAQVTPPFDQLPAAPTSMHVRAIADHLGLDRLVPILEFFQTRLKFPEGTFFPDVQEDVIAAAELVDAYAPSLPVEQRYALACIPLDLDEHLFRSTFAEWLELLDAGKTVHFPRRVDSSGGLESLEETLKLTTVYRWLALKFPEAFTDSVQVEQIRRDATEQVQAILRRHWGKQGLARRECNHCGRALLPSSPYRTCRECYSEGFG